MIGFQLEQTAIGGGGFVKLFSLVVNVTDRRIDLGALLAAAEGPLQLDQRLIAAPVEVQ